MIFLVNIKKQIIFEKNYKNYKMKFIGPIIFLGLFSTFFFLMQSFIFKRIAILYNFNYSFKHTIVIISLIISTLIVAIVAHVYWNLIVKMLFVFFTTYIGIVWVLFMMFLVYAFLNLFNVIPQQIWQYIMPIAAIIIIAYSIINASIIKINEFKIYSNKIKKTYTFAQISDTHLGSVKGKKFFNNILEKIDKYNVDALFITGDFIDDVGLIDDNLISDIRDKKYDVFYVTGNHETYGNIKHILNVVKNTQKINLLYNESVIYKELVINGVEDLGHTRKEKFNKLKDSLVVDKSKYNIFLTHQPVDFEYYNDFYADLQLSGHTHNGQIFPFNYFVKLMYKYNRGLYEKDNMKIIVSVGTGIWGPLMRLGTNNEIIIIKLIPEN